MLSVTAALHGARTHPALTRVVLISARGLRHIWFRCLPPHASIMAELRVIIGVLLLALLLLPLLRLPPGLGTRALNSSRGGCNRRHILHMLKQMIESSDLGLWLHRIEFVRVHPVAQGFNMRLIVLHEGRWLRELSGLLGAFDFLLLHFAVDARFVKFDWELI